MQDTVQPVKRKRSRTRREWLDVYRGLRAEASPFEKEVIRFALLSRSDFPTPEYQLKRTINEAEIPSTQVVPSHKPSGAFDIDLRRLFKEAATERSLNYLKSLQPPKDNYNPCPTVDELRASFRKNNYFISEDDIFTIHQAISSGRAIKVDGPPGVGKSELATQIALAMGLDVKNPYHFGNLFVTPDISKDEAFYRWNDALRLVDMQLINGFSDRMDNEHLQALYEQISENTYSPRYLDVQSLVRSCVIPYRTVCLVDEVDKAYHEFDNYMLDVVDKNSFVVPEFGRVGREFHDPKTSPIFVLTSNMTRALSGPLVRRCKAVFYDYLDEILETNVVSAKTGMTRLQAGRVASFFKSIRRHERIRLQHPPSTAEVIETAKSLLAHGMEVTEQNIFKLHGHWIKYRVDYHALQKEYLQPDGTWANRLS